MKSLIFAVGLVLISCYDFNDYVKQFNKSYSEQEYAVRKEIFNKKYAQMEEDNSQNLGFTQYPNNRTDQTQQELKTSASSVTLNSSQISDFPVQTLKVSAAASLNWNLSGKVTRVKDQGQCGDCWAFVSVAMCQSYLLVKVNRSFDLSEQYVLECSGNDSSCNGGYVTSALKLVTVTRPGIPLQATFPYRATYSSVTPSTPGICTSSVPRTALPKGTGYRVYNDLNVTQIKALLANAPVVGTIYSQPRFQNYRMGFLKCQLMNRTDINHFVLVVGYDDKGNWIVKNSWGMAWGMNGFAYIDQEYDCGIKMQVYALYDNRVRSDGSMLKYTLITVVLILMCLM